MVLSQSGTTSVNNVCSGIQAGLTPEWPVRSSVLRLPKLSGMEFQRQLLTYPDGHKLSADFCHSVISCAHKFAQESTPEILCIMSQVTFLK